MNKNQVRIIDLSAVQTFEKSESQIEGFFDEIGNLAKKKPDDAINTFKLKYINYALGLSNELLKDEYRPFPDFDTFDADDLPSNSDVVLILSQYLRSLDKFRRDHTKRGELHQTYFYWHVKDANEVYKAKHPKVFT